MTIRDAERRRSLEEIAQDMSTETDSATVSKLADEMGRTLKIDEEDAEKERALRKKAGCLA